MNMGDIRLLNRSEYFSDDMANSNYTLIVEQYLFGQLRIKLTDIRKFDSMAPEGHGGIVRELDTYDTAVAAKTLLELSESTEPETWCINQERDWNCEYSGNGPLPGDRIRLDETPDTNPYRRCAKQHFRRSTKSDPVPQAFLIVNTRGIF